ncbi:hypothetical protein Adt_15372 [Abeliophyllum distichum]|uniref:Uncharacterized protein n=1 Tax=Abeliophyllum distichum TaxID=126358 RepID=A0ABD1U3E3_9LAMI
MVGHSRQKNISTVSGRARFTVGGDRTVRGGSARWRGSAKMVGHSRQKNGGTISGRARFTVGGDRMMRDRTVREVARGGKMKHSAGFQQWEGGQRDRHSHEGEMKEEIPAD